MSFTINNKRPLLLASGSPRRSQLLSKVGIEHDIYVSNADENISKIKPEDAAGILAKRKLKAALQSKPDYKVSLAADTTVLYNKVLMEKPADKDEAFEMLKIISGKIHHVITGVAMRINDELITFKECTEVEFHPIPDESLKKYIAAGKPFDKAGGYGIQDWLGIAYIKSIKGDYYNVMGLPVSRVYQILLKTKAIN